MEHWQGAQWLMIFIFVMRAILGALADSGFIRFQDLKPPSALGHYFGKRTVDLGIFAILVWGGFFAA